VGNVGHMERKLDQIYIRNVKLYVNIPRYQRYELEPNKATRRDYRNLHMEVPRDTRKLHLDAHVIHRKKRRKEVWMEKKGKSPLLT